MAQCHVQDDLWGERQNLVKMEGNISAPSWVLGVHAGDDFTGVAIYCNTSTLPKKLLTHLPEGVSQFMNYIGDKSQLHMVTYGTPIPGAIVALPPRWV